MRRVDLFRKGIACRLVLVTILSLLFTSTNFGFVTLAAGEATFVDYAQCANGKPPSTSTACPDGWINGILNPNNSHYSEDQVTPQRAEVVVPAGSSATGRTLTFRYEARKGSIHAYDSLATWNWTQTTADRCQDLLAADCVGGAASTKAIPADPTVVADTGPGSATSGHQLPGQVMTMYGGVLDSVSAPSHDNAAGPGDDFATVVVTYHVVDTSVDRKVQLLFGGHLAPSFGPRGWGVGLGSSNVSGGPYHIKWDLADGASIGNRDNQIMASAILLPSLAITKTADAGTVTAGTTIGFTITVSNTGQGAATNVSMTDTLPTTAGLSWSVAGTTGTPTCNVASDVLTCTKASLAAGTNFSVHITSPTTAATCGTVNNSASVTADGGQSAGPASASVTVNCPDVAITKTGSAAVSAGGTATFTVTVTAGGTGNSTNVTVSDTLPAGTWTLGGANAGECSITSGVLTCNFGTMAPSSSKTVTLSRTTTAQDCPAISNTATVSATGDTNSGNNSATGSVIVNCGNVGLTKTADAGTVTAGTSIGFTITATNNGAGTATGVTVTDTLPTDAGLSWSIDAAGSDTGCAISTGVLTCNFGSVAPSTSKHVHISSPTSAATCGTVNNSANVTTTNDGSAGPATASVTVNCPDVSITKTGSAAVSAGGTVSFTITVSAGGTGSSTNVTLNDTLPAGTWTIGGANAIECHIASGTLTCPFGTMASGTSKTVTVSRASTAQDCPAISNTATVSATVDTNTNNNSSTATATVNCGQLLLDKTPDALTVIAGQPIGFLLAVSNTGNGTLSAVTVTDTLPTNAGLSWSIDAAGSDTGCAITSGVLNCSFGSLAPSASKHVHITSPTTAATCGTVTNSANATSSNDGTSQAGPISVTVACRPDVTVAKTAGSASVNAGQAASYTITVTAGGTGGSTNVTLSDNLTSTGLTWTVSGANAASCSPNPVSGALTCNFGTMASGTSKTITLTATTTTASCANGLDNTATVSATGDTNTENNSAGPIHIAVVCPAPPPPPPPPPATPTLAVSKSADAPFVNLAVGGTGTIGFKISLTNTGSVTTTATLADTPLLGVNPSTAAGTAGTAGVTWSIDPAGSDSDCTITSNVLSCNFGALTPSQMKHVHIVATVTGRATVAGRDDNCGQRAENVATATFGGGLTVTSNRAIEDVNCVLPAAPQLPSTSTSESKPSLNTLALLLIGLLLLEVLLYVRRALVRVRF